MNRKKNRYIPACHLEKQHAFAKIQFGKTGVVLLFGLLTFIFPVLGPFEIIENSSLHVKLFFFFTVSANEDLLPFSFTLLTSTSTFWGLFFRELEQKFFSRWLLATFLKMAGLGFFARNLWILFRIVFRKFEFDRSFLS